MSQRKRERIKQAILAIKSRSVSSRPPTPAEISTEMGRKTRTLNGRESAYRREVLYDLDRETEDQEPTTTPDVPDNLPDAPDDIPDSGVGTNLPDAAPDDAPVNADV